MKRWRYRFAGIICLILLCILGNPMTVKADKQIYEFFYENSCASCHEEDQIHDLFARCFSKEERQKLNYEIRTYNVFQSDNQRIYEERLTEAGKEEEKNRLPVLLAEGEWIFGYEEIEAKIRPLLLEEEESTSADEKGREDLGAGQKKASGTEKSKTTEGAESSSLAAAFDQLTQLPAAEEENVLLLFTTYSCQDCKKVKTFLRDLAKREKFTVWEYNIAEDNWVNVCKALYEDYDVQGSKQQVPAIFYGTQALTGADEITKRLEGELTEGSAAYRLMKPKLQSLKNLEDDAQIGGDSESHFQIPAMFGAGLLAGLNPCSVSMLLMLFSILITTQTSVLKNGLLYLAGKYVTYFGLGFGIYLLASKISQERLAKANSFVSLLVIVLFLAAAVLNGLDFWNIRRQEYGRIVMQLPTGLRRFNHQLIKQAGKASDRLLPFLVLGLGILVSLGEFFCTGQVYMASILYMLRSQSQNLSWVGLAFLVYVTAMCIPALVFILIIHKTKNTNRISEFMFQHLDLVKLATAILFLVFALYFIWFV